jgi:hypothetical protein
MASRGSFANKLLNLGTVVENQNDPGNIFGSHAEKEQAIEAKKALEAPTAKAFVDLSPQTNENTAAVVAQGSSDIADLDSLKKKKSGSGLSSQLGVNV